MKIAWIFLGCMLVATGAGSEAYAQKRTDAATCSRGCEAWCAKNMPGVYACANRCTTRRCNH